MSKLNLKVLLAIAIIPISLSANATHIAKGLSGAACQTANNSDVVLRGASGKMYNRSNKTQRWTCPIVKSNMAGSMRNAEVYVVNNKGRFTCKLSSRNKYGTSYGTKTVSTTLAGPNVQLLKAGYLRGAGFGTYDFRCTVPGKSATGRSSAVVDYLWDEH